MSTRTLHLNLSILNAGHHPGAWRLAGSPAEELAELGYFRRLIQAAETGRFDSIYLSDLLFADRTLTRSPQTQRLDALTLLAALAATSKYVGLVAGASATHTLPYNLARRLASFDHVSNGRAGWGVVHRTDAESRANFGAEAEPPEAGLDSRAVEFIDVLTKLWDSWEDDATVADKEAGIYVDTAKVHEIAHRGASFKVSGPIDVPRSPQGHPVFFQESVLESGEDLLLSTGGVVILRQADIERTRAQVEAIRTREIRCLANPEPFRILAPLGAIVAESAAQARQLHHELDRLAGAPEEGIVAGTAETVADHIERWFAETGIDGFDLRPPALPRDLDAFVAEVVPLLQRRGLFRTAYEGTTLRDHYGFARPVSRYAAA